MRTESLADQVGAFVAFTRELYDSHEWMNVRAALARLVIHADELTTRSIRLALDELTMDRTLSVAYRRQVWARWRRFFRWAVEHELAAAEILVHVSAWRPRYASRNPKPPNTPEKPLDFDRIRDAIPILPQPSRDIVLVLAVTGA